MKIGFFSNLTVFLGIGVVLLLQAVFIYAPFMHTIFNTVPLTFEEIIFAVIFGFAIFPVIGLEKWVYSILTRRK